MSDIFISYARSDIKIAESLAEVLKKQDWTVWLDTNLDSGEIFADVIENELDLCKCVIVLWSKSSIKKRWVKTEASEGAKRDILAPVKIEEVTIPLEFRQIHTGNLIDWKGEIPHPEVDRLIDAVEKILGGPREINSETERVDSKKVEDEISKQDGIKGRAVEEKAGLPPHSAKKEELKPTTTKQVRQVLRFKEVDKEQQPKKKEVNKSGILEKKSKLVWLLPSILTPVIGGIVFLGIHNSNSNKSVPSKQITNSESVEAYKRPVITEIEQVETYKRPVITEKKFRSKPKTLTSGSVKSMLKEKGFFDSKKNKSATGFSNDYELRHNGEIVYDKASGLMWQQSGSNYMDYERAKSYVSDLNSRQIDGYNDWRLPTLVEAMSLMEPVINGLHIDSKFDSTQTRIWTSDQYYDASIAWVAGFDDGGCNSYDCFYGGGYVRAVR